MFVEVLKVNKTVGLYRRCPLHIKNISMDNNLSTFSKKSKPTYLTKIKV